MNDELLKGLEYLKELPPSKWNAAFILRFKVKLLPKLIEYISNNPDEKKDIVAEAERIFNS